MTVDNMLDYLFKKGDNIDKKIKMLQNRRSYSMYLFN